MKHVTMRRVTNPAPAPSDLAAPPHRSGVQRWLQTGRAALIAVVLTGSGYACLAWHALGRPLYDDPARVAIAILRRWSRWARRSMRLRARVVGTVPPGRCAIVLNHRSYLDIVVVGDVFEATFLSRGDVATWPLIGPVLLRLEAIFVDRDDTGDRSRAARAILRTLRHRSVIIFPEGTTTAQQLPAEFPAGLFRLLQRTGVPIVPATIVYDDRRAYWDEDLSLWQHLRQRVAAGPPIHAVLYIGEPLLPQVDESAEGLRDRVYDAVAAPLRGA